MDNVSVILNAEHITCEISTPGNIDGSLDATAEIVDIRRDRNGMAALTTEDMYLGGLMCE